MSAVLQVVWHGYVQAMRQAGFSGDLVLYVASGLLTYGANEGAPQMPPISSFFLFLFP